jgi:hypothetical protein
MELWGPTSHQKGPRGTSTRPKGRRGQALRLVRQLRSELGTTKIGTDTGTVGRVAGHSATDHGIRGVRKGRGVVTTKLDKGVPHKAALSWLHGSAPSAFMAIWAMYHRRGSRCSPTGRQGSDWDPITSLQQTHRGSAVGLGCARPVASATSPAGPVVAPGPGRLGPEACLFPSVDLTGVSAPVVPEGEIHTELRRSARRSCPSGTRHSRRPAS